MQRYVFKVFYIGAPYSGFQRQPTGNTVENHLENAFQQEGLIHNFRAHNYRSASRTDKGVSALGNLFQLDLETDPNLYMLNSRLPDDMSILLLAKAKVPEDFRVRPVKEKEYHYRLPSYHEEILPHLHRIKQFEGTHDFRNFIRKERHVERPTVCMMHEASCHLRSDGIHFTFRADHYGWEMIRRIVGYMTSPKHITSQPKDFLVETTNHPRSPTAPAEFLTLVNVVHFSDLAWEPLHLHSLVRKKLERLRQKVLRQRHTLLVTEQLLQRLETKR